MYTSSEIITMKVKNAFYNDQPWTPKVCLSVACKISRFKEIMRVPFPFMEEKEFLDLLASYSEQDILDMFKGHETILAIMPPKQIWSP